MKLECFNHVVRAKGPIGSVSVMCYFNKPIIEVDVRIKCFDITGNYVPTESITLNHLQAVIDDVMQVDWLAEVLSRYPERDLPPLAPEVDIKKEMAVENATLDWEDVAPRDLDDEDETIERHEDSLDLDGQRL